MVKFDRYKCLRTDYFHNQCNVCKELCPDAVDFKNRINIDENKLDYSVIGACPSQAFDSDDFDKMTFILKFCNSKENRLSQSDLIALEALSILDFTSIALRKQGFEIYTQNALVLERVAQANILLREFGFDYSIQIVKESVKNRREFFTKIFSEIKNKELDAKTVYSYESRIPQSMQFFKNSIKPLYESVKTTPVAASLFHSKSIDNTACDNCGECVKFCPTDALFYDSNRTQIHFLQGACIGCSICDHICHANALKSEDIIDLIALAFDKSIQLATFNLVACSECKTPFPQKKDETVCKVCSEFSQKYDMFALASQL